MRIAAIDPSLSNFGMAKLEWHGFIGFEVLDLKLVGTERQKGKVVRQNSDDLRRGREITDAFQDYIADCEFVFAEVPHGSQSSRGMFMCGFVIGVLANCRIPLIEVQASETKKATVGVKTASKAEMISWATTRYPNAPWIKRAGKLTLANEHLADAVAIAHAGVKTDQFRQVSALMKRVA